jgi:hypothetical protein
MVKPGTLWTGGEGKNFRVISVSEVEGHTWVYYREDLGIKVPTAQCREFSCYQESFVYRFKQVAE